MATSTVHVEGNVAYIALRNGRFAPLDPQDAERVSLHSWYVESDKRRDGVVRTSYLFTKIPDPVTGKRKHVSLHRFILNAPIGVWVDHIDGNGLNNKRANLRLVTPVQSAQNRRKHSDSQSQYKGASLDKNSNLWQSYITVAYKTKSLGYFDSAEKAAKCYDEAARQFYGDFACLNFPTREEQCAQLGKQV